MGFGDFVKKAISATVGGIDPTAAVTSAVGIGGDIIGGMEANRINRHMARDQMQFQELMSNTAHQREMRDLYKAGLNPILSAKYGGASTPSGALGHVENVAKGLPNTVAQAVSLPVQLANTRSQTDSNIATTDLNKSNKESVDIKNKFDKDFYEWLQRPDRIVAKENYFQQRAAGNPYVGLASTFGHGLSDVADDTIDLGKKLIDKARKSLERGSSSAKHLRDSTEDFLNDLSDKLREGHDYMMHTNPFDLWRNK